MALKSTENAAENGGERELYSFCGSPIYIAPETLKKEAYDFKVDYYALGVLFFEMLTGQPPFNYSNQNLIKEAKLTQEVKYPEKLDPRIQDILQNLLHREPERRITELDYFKLRLLELGVDLDVIAKDRYQYEILIEHDYVKSRGKSPTIEVEPYKMKDP